MLKISRVTRAVAPIVAVAALAASPAAASSGTTSTTTCTNDLDVNACVNYALDVASRTVEYAAGVYGSQVQPVVNTAACVVVEVVTTREC